MQYLTHIFQNVIVGNWEKKLGACQPFRLILRPHLSMRLFYKFQTKNSNEPVLLLLKLILQINLQ